MEKYVKLEDVKALLNKLNNEPAYQHEDEDFYSGVCAVDCELSTLAIVEVADHTVHGKWVGRCKSGQYDDYYCSVCGTYEEGTRNRKLLGNYCPNCGAKMIKEDQYEV
jgi:rubrerythrin